MALFWHHDNNKVKMYVVFFKNLINKQHIIINNKYYIAFIVEQKDTTCIALFREFSKHGFLFCGNYILKYW
jgi:hypothetical protein